MSKSGFRSSPFWSFKALSGAGLGPALARASFLGYILTAGIMMVA